MFLVEHNRWSFLSTLVSSLEIRLSLIELFNLLQLKESNLIFIQVKNDEGCRDGHPTFYLNENHQPISMYIPTKINYQVITLTNGKKVYVVLHAGIRIKKHNSTKNNINKTTSCSRINKSQINIPRYL